jgi:hypothetical protein
MRTSAIALRQLLFTTFRHVSDKLSRLGQLLHIPPHPNAGKLFEKSPRKGQVGTAELDSIHCSLSIPSAHTPTCRALWGEHCQDSELVYQLFDTRFELNAE